MACSTASMTHIANRFGRFLPLGIKNSHKCTAMMNPTLLNTVRQFSTRTITSQLLFHPTLQTTLRLLDTTLQSHYHPNQNIFSLPLVRNFSSQQQMMSSSSTPTASTEPNTGIAMVDDEPFPNIPISEMSNEELADTRTIYGWDLIHSPPQKLPRGALIGTVISDKMNKTINVAVVRFRVVPKVRKRVRYTRKFMAHDEAEVANMGDVVMITPSHRISKNKHFMLREIIRPKGQL